MNSGLGVLYPGCSEKLVGEVIEALHAAGWWPGINPKTVPLEKLLAPLDAEAGSRGRRITSITEGPAKHQARFRYGGKWHHLKEFEVPKGKVYATIDSSVPLAGTCDTYMFSRQEDGKLKYEDEYCHFIR